ncbi:esterase-like activity of phytase family protein [Frankia sp. AgPm24]|uniref:esterase-like activity of phytase family protein n=1 Tax=Frankia sp. AgPm24 TaxID=631128 RepID=UPI00200F279D|nr:esterase-like activity of phytase family protein [Frankia sp. AgPm24]MCK9920895.1 esterase-like activity of phytase family protein [Frankia sp. AgPm24]
MSAAGGARRRASGRRAVSRRRGMVAVAGLALALPMGLLTGPGVALAGPPASGAGSVVPTVVRTGTLPDTSLASFANALLPGSVPDDHGVKLGGIGSDLYPAGAPNEFWTITDRGPNGQIKVDGKNRRTFPVPGFDPAILRVRVEGSTIRVLTAVAITTTHGKPVTGLSNIDGVDETPYTWDATTKLAFDPNGLDTEGLVRTRNGEFWVVDEYSPSLLRISPTGRVLARYVPAGVRLTGADYPVIATLPAILGSRKINRGFEGITLAPDGRTLYLAVQSPLQLPDADTGDASRNTRILRFDTSATKVTGEYVYRFEDVTTFDPSAEGDPSELKISSLAAVNDHTLLVDERTDPVARLYTVDLRGATNILGTTWDTATTSPSLESLADPSSADVRALRKTLAVDLEAVPGMPDKIEGVAVLGPRGIAVANDNDFGLGTFDAAGRLVDSGVRSRILLLHLNRPLA